MRTYFKFKAVIFLTIDAFRFWVPMDSKHNFRLSLFIYRKLDLDDEFYAF